MPARWVAASVPPEADALVSSVPSRRLAALLALRGVPDPAAAAAFLSPRREDLFDPQRLPGFGAALDRLDRALDRGERVLLVGDYDVDGVSSTALVAATLRALGAEVETWLPRRDAEGYGLQAVHARRAAERGAALLVALDSGTNARDAAATARELGVDLLVVDHHLPEADARDEALVVNPRLDGSYPCPDLTAAGLALKLSAALLERRGREVPWESLLRVAALGTIADVAPLVGENRVIAALGLAALGAVRSPGLRALIEVAALRAPISASDVAFRLAPRLNAAGRLASADTALELLLTRDPARARALAAELHAQNAERQRIEEALLVEARADHAERSSATSGAPGIVVGWRAGWHRGVVGIAAARLAREANRPTLLLAVEGDLATGSGRSAEGIELHEFLRPWAPRMERFGGHAQAIGLTVRADLLEAFRSEWEEAARVWAPRLAERQLRYELALELTEVDDVLLGELDRLAPFGAGNPEPVFRFGPCRLAGQPRSFGRGHLGFVVTPSSDAAGDRSARVPVVAWRKSERDFELARPFELLAAVERDRPRGARLRLVDLRPAEPAP